MVHSRPAARRSGWKTAAVTATAVLMVVFAAASVTYFLFAQSGAGGMSFIQAQAGSTPWNGRDRLTALLIGVDGAAPGSSAHSLTVVSLDPRTRSLSLLSVPENLWVTVPGYGQAPISEAYRDGGTRLAVLTVESAIQVPIPYYAALSSSTLAHLVDAFGGLSLGPPVGTAGTSGGSTLTGAKVAALLAPQGSHATPVPSRIRQFLLALLQQGLNGGNILRVPGIVSALGGAIATNIPYNQMNDIAHALALVPSSRIRIAALDAAGAASPYDTNGSVVYAPIWQSVAAVGRNLFGSPPSSGARVAVLNGSGIPGQAASLASWLSGAGIPVGRVGTAASSSVPHTRVVLSAAAGVVQRALARDVASMLGAPLMRTSTRVGNRGIAVIIGQDYQDLSQP